MSENRKGNSAAEKKGLGNQTSNRPRPTNESLSSNTSAGGTNPSKKK
ncbi:hypothetical protein PT158_08230 [Erysipelothrix rhusiopathiae]|nr:hypothetical protein [Erysipelothrix rhusiopathiae]MDE8323503.1 hypothetical protein [Erysipelothrix rhusiopathiae]